MSTSPSKLTAAKPKKKVTIQPKKPIDDAKALTSLGTEVGLLEELLKPPVRTNRSFEERMIDAEKLVPYSDSTSYNTASSGMVNTDLSEGDMLLDTSGDDPLHLSKSESSTSTTIHDDNQSTITPEALFALKSAKIRTIREDARASHAKVAQGLATAVGARIGKISDHKYSISRSQMAARDQDGAFTKQEVIDMKAMWVKDCWDGLVSADSGLTIQYFMKACPTNTPSGVLNSWIHRAYANLSVRKAMTQIANDSDPTEYLDLLYAAPQVSVSIPRSLSSQLEENVKEMQRVADSMEVAFLEFIQRTGMMESFVGEMKANQSDFISSVENKTRQIVSSYNKAMKTSDKDSGQLLSQRSRTSDLYVPNKPASGVTPVPTEFKHGLSDWEKALQ